VRAARPVDDEEQHREDADHEPGQDVDHDHAEQRGEPERELDTALGVVAPELLHPQQVEDGVGDERPRERHRVRCTASLCGCKRGFVASSALAEVERRRIAHAKSSREQISRLA
jgi:hypothetical protein